MKLNEAGRKVSKANERKLRAALKEINDILALLDGDEGEEMAESVRSLVEAANLGNWLESRLHLSFTMLADDLFGDGRLTRAERVALSGAIGDALDAFNAAVAESMPQIYQRGRWVDAEPMQDMAEAGDASTRETVIDGEVVPLVERALRRDGTVALRLIEPGWGASGYYAPEVLQRDGPKVFTKALKGFWNHPTAMEEAERPEGDLNALAMELVSDARYEANGPAGPGLYADAKVFGPYREAINELAPHIGVSIRASGPVKWGSAEGREGKIVQGISAAKSCDFVTLPGAGGEIIELFEAARVHSRPEGTRRKPAIVPPTQEGNVNEQQFQEAVSRLETQNQAVAEQNAALAKQNEALVQQAARFREALLLREARDVVQTSLSKETLPDVTRARLVESLAANPPITDAGELDKPAFATRISEAVKAEVTYLTQAAGYGSGRIEGMGPNGLPGGQAPSEDAVKAEAAATASLTESFRALGMSEKEAAIAAKGRGY